jgi:hypothetical protein
MTKYYVSITGLKLKSIWYYPKFVYYTSRAMKNAKIANGNISANGSYRNGVLHTLSVWKDKRSMTQYLVAGAHADAMKINDDISLPNGTKVYGHETDHIPTWEEAIQMWQEKGTRHGKLVPNETTKSAGGPPLTFKSTTLYTLVILAIWYYYNKNSDAIHLALLSPFNYST